MVKVTLALSVCFPNTDHVTTVSTYVHVSSNYVVDMQTLLCACTPCL